MSVQMNIKRQPVIQRRYLTIDLQCCTVILSGEQIYGAVWKECVAGCEHVVYNVICQLRKKLKNPDLIQTVVGRGYRFVE